MSELFIPPEGAMQFEATTHPMPAFRDARLWVQPTTAKPQDGLRERIGCQCKHFYEILHCDPPELWKGQWTVVCKCLGRIIE